MAALEPIDEVSFVGYAGARRNVLDFVMWNKPRPPLKLKFCGYCGAPFKSTVHSAEHSTSVPCAACDYSPYAEIPGTGHALLVLTVAFAEDRMLLLKRGTSPYRGSWAPSGGFVERGESVEQAAVREVHEEVGIQIPAVKLIPHGLVSLPSLNQVYVVFVAVLECAEPLHPAFPEALDARWFSREEYPRDEIWEPASAFDINTVFERVKSGKFEFWQQSDDSARLISNEDRITYLWRR